MGIYEAEDLVDMEEGTLDLLVRDLQDRVRGSTFPRDIVPRTDPEFLKKFLRTKDFNNEAALASVHKFYGNINRNFSYIQGMKPSDFRVAFASGTITVLQSRISGSRVGVFRVRKWSPKESSIRDLQLVSYFLIERAIREKETQQNGIIFVYDLSGLTFEQLRKLSLKELRRMLVTIQEGLPIRIAGLHFLHPPPFFWSMYQVIMLFLKEKLRKRLKLHYTFESLHESIGSAGLPESLGGDLAEGDAHECRWIEELLKQDVPYEEYWNGSYVRQT